MSEQTKSKELEAFLSNLITTGCSQTTADSLKTILNRLLPHADQDLQVFIELLDAAVADKAEPAKELTAKELDELENSQAIHISYEEVTADILAKLGIKHKLSADERTQVKQMLKSALHSVIVKNKLLEKHISDEINLKKLIRLELDIDESEELPNNVLNKLKEYDDLYQAAFEISPYELTQSLPVDELLDAQAELFKQVNIVNIQKTLADPIKMAFADFRRKNGLVNFLKFVGGDIITIKQYLDDVLPEEFKLTLKQVSDKDKFLLSVITQSIGELIMGKTIDYSAHDLARLTESVNEYFSKDFTEDEPEQALRDFVRNNYLEGYDNELITQGKSDDFIRQAIRSYAKNELLAKNMMARGGQAQSFNITFELARQFKYKGQECMPGKVYDELLYLIDEEGQKYIQIKQDVYAVIIEGRPYALSKKGTLEPITGAESEKIRQLTEQGKFPSRKPIAQAVMRIDMHTERDTVKYQVTDFNVKLNAKDVHYNYRPAIKPNVSYQAKPAPAKIKYNKKVIKEFNDDLNRYFSALIKRAPKAAIKDFQRHNYIDEAGYETLKKDAESIAATVNQYAGDTVVSEAMLSCGGQVLQAFILQQVDKLYLYNGAPISTSFGIETHIKYSKQEKNIVGQIVFNSYIAQFGEAYYALSENNTLEIISAQQVSELKSKINRGETIERKPIFSTNFKIEIKNDNGNAKFDVKDFSTLLIAKDPAITVRPAKLSQDYERLRRKIIRLNDELLALDKKHADFEEIQEKLEQNISLARAHQQEIDRAAFNGIFYYADHKKDWQPKITNLSNLQVKNYAQKKDEFTLKNESLKRQVEQLKRQKQEIIDAMLPQLINQYKALSSILLEDIAPAFNKAFDLMTKPEIVLSHRITEQTVEAVIKPLIQSITERLTDPSITKLSFNDNLVDKERFVKFLKAIDNCLADIDKVLENYRTNKLERGMHSAVKAINKQPVNLLGSRHDKIQLSKNLKAYKEQLNSLKAQLETSDYYCAKSNNFMLNNNIYKNSKAQDAQQTIQAQIEANPQIRKLDKEIARCEVQIHDNNHHIASFEDRYLKRNHEVQQDEEKHLQLAMQMRGKH